MINTQKIRAAVDKEYQGLCEGCFAHWITCLFVEYDGFTFEENKEAFFYLIGRLLREGKARFIAPGVDCYISPSNPNPRYSCEDEDAHWKASPEEIIASLKSQWPTDVSEVDDVEMIVYLHTIPGIIWLGDDGEWHGS
jgi:hypothetical protein